MEIATHKFTAKAYINKMLPHLLPMQAKKIGIKQSDKKEWKDLARRIKLELEDRYENASEEELERDMSFNRRAVSTKPSDFQFLINDEVVKSTRCLPVKNREWVRNARIDLLSKSISGESELARRLNESGIKAIQKFPIIYSEKTYFAGICLPEHGIIIEITKKDVPVVRAYGYMKDRAELFKKMGYFVEFISSDKAKDAGMVNVLINKIRLYAKSYRK